MTDQVDKTLRLWRQGKFVWEQADCITSIADYLVALGHPDFCDIFRGRYHNEIGALALLKEYGGERNVMNRCGLPVTTDPQRGDIVLIQPAPRKRPVAGICTGPGYAMRVFRGIVEIDKVRVYNLVDAWKVN